MVMVQSVFSQKVLDSVLPNKLETVQLDSRIVASKSKSGRLVTIITAEELEIYKGQSISTVLNSVSGIEINGARSNLGQNLGYYFRGGRNRQLVVLLDGVRISDASQIANDFDLRFVTIDQVESIEIMKGASSTLYGSGASAVVSIKSKKPKNIPVSVVLSTLLGTNQSDDNQDFNLSRQSQNLAISGSSNRWHYQSSYGLQSSSGMSSASNGTEDDPFKDTHFKLSFGYEDNNKWSVGVFYSTDEFEAQFDDGLEDANNVLESSLLRAGTNINFNYPNGQLVGRLVHSENERKTQSSFPSIYRSKSSNIDLFNRYDFHKNLHSIVGIDFQESKMQAYSLPWQSEDFEQVISPEVAFFRTVDPYLNFLYTSKIGLNFNTGMRLNTHSTYGNHFVYSLNPSFDFTKGSAQIKLLGTYSHAFITPSLYQLFEPTYGNINLDPESNTTYEFGSEIKFANGTLLSLLFFNRLESNFVYFADLGNFEYQYKNSNNRFTASGFELNSKLINTKNIELLLNFTYTDVEESLDLRIPKFKLNGQLSYVFGPEFSAQLHYNYTDDRKDSYYNNTNFQTESVMLNRYHLFDLYLQHKLFDDNCTLLASFQNIFNSSFEELYGYSTLGRNVSIGLQIKLAR